MGKVYFPSQAEWSSVLVSELLRFPSGVNDDQVDVLSLLGRMLNDLVKGSKPATVTPIRGINNMTFGEVVKLAKPQRRGRI